MQNGIVCEEHCILFEKHCREKLLQIPDKAILKSAIDFANEMQATFEKKDEIIDHYRDLYHREKLINETRCDVMKEYLSHEGYQNIKKETRKRVKMYEKNQTHESIRSTKDN